MTQHSQTNDTALVLFSGGQDSTTCLAWALSRYRHVETIGFHYGQRHAIEMACREPIRRDLASLERLSCSQTSSHCASGLSHPQATENKDIAAQTRDLSSMTNVWSGTLGTDHVVDLTTAIGDLGQTAMTQEVAIESDQGGLPNTFVPGRNLLFLTCAAAIAYRRGLRRIVAGVCETDYSGYPDCRDDTVKAMQLALNLGMQRRFILETPLMWIDKAATWALAASLGGQSLINIIREQTHTCYLGNRTNRHAWGYGCETCPACALRAQGWDRWLATGAALDLASQETE